MIHDHFAELVARHLAGECSSEEQKELEVLLKEDPQAHYFYELFSKYWSAGQLQEVNPVQQEVHFQQIIAIAENERAKELSDDPTVQKRTGRIFTLKRFLVAASITAVIVSSYFIFFRKNDLPPKQIAVNEVEAKKGTRSFMLLPDGTKVWLNSESKLEYSTAFNKAFREVNLVGEAYFDVVKDPSHPFIVHTSDIDIRVLGTAFNVKSYPKECCIEATLIHGQIEVRNNKQSGAFMGILHPNDKFVFHKPEVKQATPNDQHSVNKIFTITKLQPRIQDAERVETSWVYNKLVFDGETFKEAAVKMERWYNVKINIENAKAANATLHYRIENETIEEALKYLKEFVVDFKYEINGDEIQIL